MSACPNCDGPMPEPATTGPPRIYCSDACRHEAHHQRRKARGTRTAVHLEAERWQGRGACRWTHFVVDTTTDPEKVTCRACLTKMAA